MEHTAMAPGQRLYAYHSGAPDEDTYTRAVDELLISVNTCLKDLGAAEITPDQNTSLRPSILDNPQWLIPAYGSALVREAEANHDIVALDADLALDCGLLPFEEQFPNRFFECGIAEQDMISQAGGMALKGLLPRSAFLCLFPVDPTQRTNLQQRHREHPNHVCRIAGGITAGWPGPFPSSGKRHRIPCRNSCPGNAATFL